MLDCRQPPKEVLTVEEFVPVICPQDSLSLIMLFDLYEYASQTLEAEISCFSAQQYEMYSLCAMAHFSSFPYLGLIYDGDPPVDASNDQLNFIAQLVNRGTRTGLSPPDRLWSMLLRTFYSHQLSIEAYWQSDRPGLSFSTEYIVRVVEAFLGASANPFPIITLMRYIPLGPGYMIFFEIDIAKLPPIFDLLDTIVQPAEE